MNGLCLMEWADLLVHGRVAVADGVLHVATSGVTDRPAEISPLIALLVHRAHDSTLPPDLGRLYDVFLPRVLRCVTDPDPERQMRLDTRAAVAAARHRTTTPEGHAALDARVAWSNGLITTRACNKAAKAALAARDHAAVSIARGNYLAGCCGCEPELDVDVPALDSALDAYEKQMAEEGMMAAGPLVDPDLVDAFLAVL